MLLVNPEPSVVKSAIKKQYLLLFDRTTLKVHDCDISEEPSTDMLNRLFFYSNTGFLGQLQVN